MENGTGWGVWVAYAVIVAFLLFLLFLFARTMALFATLTFMPLARLKRQIERLFGRKT